MKTREVKFAVNENGCHLCCSHSTTLDGYPQIQIDKKRYYIHRIFYENSYGKIPEGIVIRHICDNRACINISHMILGTHSDNVKDRVNRGRSAKLENHGRSKLDSEKVRFIRSSVLTNTVLARKFGVSPKAIRLVRQGKAWTGII